MITVGEMIRLNARALRDKEALAMGAEGLSYGELNLRVNRVASSLQRHGIGVGDRVAVLAKNSIDYVSLYFALAKIGGILVPLNFWHRASEQRYVVGDCDPSLILHESQFAQVLDEANLPSTIPRVVLPSPISVDGVEETWSSFVRSGDEEREPDVRPEPSWPHLIIYSSGTTGLPKGAVLSHARTMEDAFSMVGALRIRQDDTFINFFPPFHVGNWDHMKLFFLSGARIVLLSEFNAEHVLRTIETERISVILGIPVMMDALLAHPLFKRTDVSSVRLLYDGSYDPGGVMRDVAEALGAAEGKIEMAFSYGLSEGGPFVTICQSQDLFEHWGSIGRPLPGVEVALLDDQDIPVAQGAPGEICVRGPRMTGYWNKPEETADALRNGWLHTGDIAIADKDGFLWMVDRKKDMIRTGGQNVYSKQVENCLLEHPAVEEVAVIGVPDRVYEEAVIAVVVPSSGARATEDLQEELRRFVRKRLAGYNVPRYVQFVEDLPKNPLGKTLKQALREQFGSLFQKAPGGSPGRRRSGCGQGT